MFIAMEIKNEWKLRRSDIIVKAYVAPTELLKGFVATL